VDNQKLLLQLVGRMADTTQPKTWARLGDCLDAIDRLKASGIGFVFAFRLDEASGHAIVVGLDLDGCRDPLTGDIKPWAKALEEFRTYTEISPSGTGLKLYGTIDRPIELAANKEVIQPANGAKAQQLEVYTTARFFALTGAHLDGTPDELCDVTEAFDHASCCPIQQAVGAAETRGFTPSAFSRSNAASTAGVSGNR
jgi:putative DNA primase/helicase